MTCQKVKWITAETGCNAITRKNKAANKIMGIFDHLSVLGWSSAISKFLCWMIVHLSVLGWSSTICKFLCWMIDLAVAWVSASQLFLNSFNESSWFLTSDIFGRFSGFVSQQPQTTSSNTLRISLSLPSSKPRSTSLIQFLSVLHYQMQQ